MSMILGLCKLHAPVHPGSFAAAECYQLPADVRRSLLLCILRTAAVAFTIRHHRACCTPLLSALAGSQPPGRGWLWEGVA